MKTPFLFMLVLVVPFAVSAAGGVVINEVAWMGTAASASDEWVELHNAGQNAVDLSGWTISFFKPATTTPSKVIALSGSIPAGGFYLIERTDENPTDIPADLVSSFGTGLVDGGMILEIAQNGAAVDRTPELCENKWCAGSNNPKMSMERRNPNTDGTVALNWGNNDGVKMNGTDAAGNAISGTPKRENSVAGATFSPAPDSSSASPSSAASSLPIYPALSVDAGFDRMVLVGSPVDFSGFALGINNAPLLDARFLWNFGDGSVREGRSLEHIYYFPGTYTAALVVSSGQYSGSDTVVITAIVPRLSVRNAQAGEDGFVTITNESDAKLDLGGMFLREFILTNSAVQNSGGQAGAQFLIPKNSFISAKGGMTIPNRVSGLLKSGNAVLLFDATGKEVRAAQPLADDRQSAASYAAVAEPARTVAQVSSSAGLSGPDRVMPNKGGTSEGDGIPKVRNEIAMREDAPVLQQETAGALQAPRPSSFQAFSPAVFFGASALVGILSVAGFFLLKNFF